MSLAGCLSWLAVGCQVAAGGRPGLALLAAALGGECLWPLALWRAAPTAYVRWRESLHPLHAALHQAAGLLALGALGAPRPWFSPHPLLFWATFAQGLPLQVSPSGASAGFLPCLSARSAIRPGEGWGRGRGRRR